MANEETLDVNPGMDAPFLGQVRAISHLVPTGPGKRLRRSLLVGT